MSSRRPTSSAPTGSAPATTAGSRPFADDTSTSRDVAFAKIGARVEGTRLASEQLGV